MSECAYSVRPCRPGDADRLAAALGVHPVTAEVLLRRGLGDAGEATRFLEADGPQHDPFLLGAMEEACQAVEGAIAAGRRIVVHGDYDVDGICATALAVETLRELGADVTWHLPSRFAEGYGVAVETVDAVADAGAGLLLTVDCGITAVEAVARARERGLAVVLTDHHRPGDELPEAPLVAARGPHAGRYPFGELCGTGVAFKLAQALWSRRRGMPPGELPPELARHLDLVALATVADVVELRGENRALARAGLRRLARGERPGLAALMRSASVDRARLRSSDLGFRLAPRINAAGRLGHPAAALELLLTRDGAEAERLAGQLEELNRERQGVEDGILRAACRSIEAWPEERRAGRAYVVWGDGWHEGVIGIVASRLVERYARPVVVVAVDGERAKGSGRSVSAFDLHAGLAACAHHLERFGGHRAAAGLTLTAAALDGFAHDFRTHADGALATEQLRRLHHVDAVVGVGDLSLELARELARLEPFGLGNPAPNLLVPAASLQAVETMGDGARHVRLQVSGGGARCGAVAFGQGDRADDLRLPGRYDVLCRLEVNEWKGAVSPRLLLRDALPAPSPMASACDGGCAGDAAEPLGGEVVALPSPRGAGPVVHDRRHSGVAGTLGRLAASGESTLVLVADVDRRRAALGGPLEPTRFGAAEPVLFCARCGDGAHAGWLARLGPGAFAVADHRTFARVEPLRRLFRHVVVLDPPAHPDEEAALRALGADVDVHVVWGPREVAFARSVVEAAALRPLLAAIWRGAPAGRPLAESDVAALAAPAPRPEAGVVDRALRVLTEARLADRAEGQVVLRAPAGKVDLAAASPTFARAEARRRESLAFLDRLEAGLYRPQAAEEPAAVSR